MFRLRTDLCSLLYEGFSLRKLSDGNMWVKIPIVSVLLLTVLSGPFGVQHLEKRGIIVLFAIFSVLGPSSCDIWEDF